MKYQQWSQAGCCLVYSFVRRRYHRFIAESKALKHRMLDWKNHAGVVGYADDIFLLSQSIHGFQKIAKTLRMITI